jgi:hypothetical protein
VTARRVLMLCGVAAVGMFMSAAPAGALPAPPAAPGLPSGPTPAVPRVGDVVTIVPTLSSPAVPDPSVPDVPRAPDSTATVGSPVPVAATATLAVRPVTRLRSGATMGSPSNASTPQPSGTAGAPGRPVDIAPVGPTVAADHSGIDAAVVNARPAGVKGALDNRSYSTPWSTLGTAATSLALWAALCALAAAARWISISAWRDAARRRVLTAR